MPVNGTASRWYSIIAYLKSNNRNWPHWSQRTMKYNLQYDEVRGAQHGTEHQLHWRKKYFFFLYKTKGICFTFALNSQFSWGQKNMCVFQVSRSYLGFCSDPNTLLWIVSKMLSNFLENGGKCIEKIFWQNKMLCRPTIPSFFIAETHTYMFWPDAILNRGSISIIKWTLKLKNIITCDHWLQGNFMTYFVQLANQRKVRWRLHVLYFIVLF